MSEQNTETTTPPPATGRPNGAWRPNRIVLLAAGALVLAVAVGVFFVFRFADAERERDLQNWQVRMGIVAESRLAAIDDWLAGQFRHLQGLAENTALQLYMTQLATGTAQETAPIDEPAQRVYLRNLLVAVAEQGGFTGPVLGPDVAANVNRLGVAGIALFDMDGKGLVATPAMPPPDARLEAALAGAPRAERQLIDLYIGAAGTPTIGFILPVFALQSNEEASSQIGWAVGLKEVADELYPLFHQPGITEETAEVVLLREKGGAAEYLSPLSDGTGALRRTLALDTPELAAGFALATPGGFGVKRDYRGIEVLAVARALAGTPWTLLYKVDTAEALADTNARTTRLIVVFLLIIGVLVVALIAVWRHGTSRRASESAEMYRKLAERFESQQKLLQLVTDSQPNGICILDDRSRFRFANEKVAQDAGIAAEDLLGKSLKSVVGPVEAARIEPVNRGVFATKEPVVTVHEVEDNGHAKVIQTRHIPLPKAVDRPLSVLLVSEDITAEVTERKRREHDLKTLVDTLVGVVDRRDPYAANHSRRVATVAHTIAEQSGADGTEQKTVEIAALLMNLGKILVPVELLTTERKLTDDELRQIRESILASAELLEGVPFDVPIVETLRQILEAWDGSGTPLGLKGQEILKSARVIAVANAFVGLVSPRAYRNGLDFDGAVDALLKDSAHKFDRSVVAALVNYLDNQGGRERWADFRSKPSGH
ncbi:MAG: HD domain-containing phosphohydrolase [Alphaproteobacteria bacterium]